GLSADSIHYVPRSDLLWRGSLLRMENPAEGTIGDFMAKKEKTRTLIWAVDPFVEDYPNQEAAIRAVNLYAASNVVVQPVYVWNGHGNGDMEKRIQEQGEA